MNRDNILAEDDTNCRQSPSELILVSGHSGTGKSSLVDNMKEESSMNECSSGHYFVTGKFDKIQRNKPYSAVSEALNSLCDVIFCSEDCGRSNGDEWAGIGLAVKRELGIGGLKKLFPVIPKLRQIIAHAGNQEHGVENVEATPSAESSTIRGSQHSFLFTLCKFIRTVCNNCCILIWFLDDLQWADPESINLIKLLLTDKRTKNLLVVGSIRQDGVDVNDQQENYFGDIEEKDSIHITRIHLGNLDEGSVNTLISDLLQCDEEKTRSLTKSVQKKTQGNIFFVLQFLEALQEEGLLWYSLQAFKWIWADDERIQSTMSVSKNVADLVVKKIERMPQELQAVLMIASCLGFHFDTELLKLMFDGNEIWESLTKIPEKNDIDVLLVTAVEEGILDKVVDMGHSVVYKFSHDHVQDSSYSLLPTGKDLEIFHLRIGELLLKKMSSSGKSQRERLLFSIVNQFNRVSKDTFQSGKKLELAKLNYQAAKIAAASSAFSPTLKYLRNAIDFITGSNPWTHHYDFMLELCTLSMGIELSIGNEDACNDLINEVLKNAKSLEDKIPVYLIKMKLLVSIGKPLIDTMDVGFDVLSMLGEKIPRKVSLYDSSKAFLKTKFMLRNLSDAVLIAIPVMTNKRKIAAVEIISFLFGSSNFRGSRHQPLLVFRLVQLSIKYGFCSISPVALAMYGAFLCGPLNDMKNGIRFGKIALSMLERVEKTDKSLAIYMVHTFINHMTEPIYKSLDPLLNSYESGMQTGEIIGAVGSIVSYCETYVMAGLPLAPIEKDIRLYHQLLVEYEQKQALDMLLPMWQFVLNLLGKSEDPSKLTGEVMDQAKFIETQKRNKNSVIGGRARIYHLELTYLLCPIDYSANLLVRLVAFIKTSLLCPCYIRFRCLHGLIALAMARKTRNKKWFKLAKGATKQVKRWVEGKTGNILHLLLLMNAEYDSLSKSNEDVKRSFDLAISAGEGQQDGRHRV